MKAGSKKKLVRWLVAVVITTTLFILLPTTTIMTTRNEVDINSGRTRTLKYFFGTKSSEEIKENAFSEYVQKYGLRREPPEWHSMNSSGYGIIGGTYASNGPYGDVFCGCLRIASMLDSKVMTDAEKKNDTEKLLGFLKDARNSRQKLRSESDRLEAFPDKPQEQ